MLSLFPASPSSAAVASALRDVALPEYASAILNGESASSPATAPEAPVPTVSEYRTLSAVSYTHLTLPTTPYV